MIPYGIKKEVIQCLTRDIYLKRQLDVKSTLKLMQEATSVKSENALKIQNAHF